MEITLKQLKILIEVAERGSMFRAATALHVTPAAISIQIKQIEGQVGLLLFNRTQKRVSLSSAGENLVVHAKRILGDLREAQNDMARFKGLGSGMLTIGMVSRGAHFLPRLLVRFREEHPAIDVKLRMGRKQLADAIGKAEVDLLLMSEPANHLSGRAETFGDNPLVFVCSPRHPLMKRSSLPVKALADHSLIVREPGTRTRTAMEAFFGEHRFSPRIAMEIPGNETIKHAVMAGMGITFLPLHAIGFELNNGLLGVLDIRDTPVIDVWTMVVPSRIMSPATEVFSQLIMREGKKELRADNSTLLSLAFKRRADPLVHPRTQAAWTTPKNNK